MLVDGSIFGFKENAFCYIPIFRAKVANKDYTNTWFVGSLFMTNYVTVYDNTHASTNSTGQTINTIGLGLKDPNCVKCGIRD